MNTKDRQQLYNKYGGKCAYCGDPLLKGWHVDEIEPVRRNKEWNGKNWVVVGAMHPERFNLNNQNPSCASCNINKHSDSLETFRQRIADFMKHLNNISVQYKIAKRYGLVSETNIKVKFYFETL